MTEIHQEDERLGRGYDAGLARRLFRLALPYRGYVGGAIAVLLLESVSQLAGPLLTGAAIDLVLSPGLKETGSGSRFVARLLGHLGFSTSGPRALDAIALLYAASVLVTFGLMILMVEWTSRVGQGVMYDLRTRIFSHLQRTDIAVYDRTPVGRLMTRLTTDVDSLNELFTSGFVALLGDLAVLGGIVAVLFALDAGLAAMTLAVLVPMVFVTNWFRKGARDTFRKVRTRIARVNAFLQEHLSGIVVVQLFRREAAAREPFREVNDLHRKANIESIFYYAVFYPALDLLSAVGVAAILWYGGFRVLHGAMTIGAVVTFIQYSKRFYRPLMDLSEKYNILQAAFAAAERIFQLLDTAPAVTAPARPLALPSPVRGEVAFEEVRFSYKPDEEILKGVSFRCPPGSTVALVGATGAGKSTVVNLLLRFYDVTSGRVTVDGVDVRDVDPVRLREAFGIVLQETFLFTGTIAENVSFFDPALPRERIEAACREVGLGPVLDRLPEGLDAKLTERGGGLSVGEKQLVSFARALARDPKVLILDEATSSVDPETEERIEKAIGRLLAGRTSLVIAHRLSTIVRADLILVLAHGEVREAGTHSELLARGGLYARLYTLQLKDREAALAGSAPAA